MKLSAKLFFAAAMLLATPALAANSPDGSTLAVGQTGSLTTSAGAWTFGAGGQGGGSQILLGGSWAAGGSAVLLEVANGGQMWVKNSIGNWYLWTGSGWSEQGGPPPSVSPPPPPPPPPPPTTGSGVCGWTTVTFTDNPHPVTAADNCTTRIWKGIAPATVQLPAPATLGANFISCYQTETQPLTFVPPAGAKMEGSPATLNHGDNPACPQVDSDGVWDIEGGAIPTATNPAQ